MSAQAGARVRVSRFGPPEVLRLERFTPRPGTGRKVRVRVTHASVGSTDAAARSGGYLLQPKPGFVPGYDFVGVLEVVNPAATNRGLRTGMRVTGCLPRMGSYTTVLDVPVDRVIPVPDTLDSAVAAALPLDLVTAALTVDLAHPPSGATIFVQGVSGSVGALIAQRAVADGMRVIGTASDRTRPFAESLGAQVVDYRDPNWPTVVRDLTGGGAEASVDHTGSPQVRTVTARSGVVVRTAWSSRRDAALGGLVSTLRRYSSPRERVCSVPLLVALRPATYRQMLHDQLDRIVDGSLRKPDVTTVPLAEAAEAHRRLGGLEPGHKLVLEMPD
jgi:NADPH:quinone reductase